MQRYRRRYRALIEYDGTAYAGFQRQREDYRTIQGEVEKALAHLAQQPVSVTAAGRTDSGVHALGQVVSFIIDWQHGTEALQRALNANLPEDIAVLQLEEVAFDFHPRYNARKRVYAYRIYNAAVRSPIHRQRSWHISQPLDETRMDEAAAHIVGIHDFATFGRPPQGESTVREVFVANWRRHDDWLTFTIEANAFLYRMVRSLVGSFKIVGDGNWTVEEFVAAFAACDRRRAGMAAPPQGLYLVSVIYEEGLEKRE